MRKRLFLYRTILYFLLFLGFWSGLAGRRQVFAAVADTENENLGKMISGQGYFDVEVRSRDGKKISALRVNLTVTPNAEDIHNKNAAYPNSAHRMQQKITWSTQKLGGGNPYKLKTEQDAYVRKEKNTTYTLHGTTEKKEHAYDENINDGGDPPTYMESAYTVFVMNFSYTKTAYTYPSVSVEGKAPNARFTTRKYILAKKKNITKDDNYIGLPDSPKTTGWMGEEASTVDRGVYHEDKKEEFSIQLNLAQTGVYLYGGQTEVCHAKCIITLDAPTLEISYRENGATSGRITKTKKMTYNDSDDLHNFSAFHLEKEGCRRREGAEWNTRADGTGISFGQDTAYPAIVYRDFSDGEEFTKKSRTVYAQWDRIYTVSLSAGEGIENVSGGGTYLPGESVTVSAAVHAWYDFEYWAGTFSGTENPYTFTMPKEDVSLTATATSGAYKIEFNSNGGEGYIEPIYPALIGRDVTLPDVAATHAFTHRNTYGESLFLGWSGDAAAREICYESGETVPSLSEEHEGTVTLYAVWDTCPGILADDRYYTLKQAQTGYITAEELMCHASAEDREDGAIGAGIDAEKNTRFEIIDFAAEEFTGFTGEGSVKETYQATDSAGNICRKQITVYIVDTTPQVISKKDVIGTTRFISEKYYKKSPENGGLAETSIWKADPEYRAALETGLSNIESKTPVRTYYFSYDTVREMKAYIYGYGIENSRSPQFLQEFYRKFIRDAVR